MMTKNIYKYDNLLLSALFIYKNNVKIIGNFTELKKSSLEDFIIRDTECPICFTEYKDLDVRNSCYKCSYHICLSCFKVLNQCPICNTEHEKIYIKDYLFKNNINIYGSGPLSSKKLEDRKKSQKNR